MGHPRVVRGHVASSSRGINIANAQPNQQGLASRRRDNCNGPNRISHKDSNQMRLPGRGRQIVPKNRVRKSDQGVRPLSGGKSLQIHNTVFGDDVMNIRARCSDRAGEPRHNLADPATLDGRLERDEGHPTPGRVGASYEIELPTS